MIDNFQIRIKLIYMKQNRKCSITNTTNKTGANQELFQLVSPKISQRRSIHYDSWSRGSP